MILKCLKSLRHYFVSKQFHKNSSGSNPEPTIPALKDKILAFPENPTISSEAGSHTHFYRSQKPYPLPAFLTSN